MSGIPSSFMPVSACGSKRRPCSWDTVKQGFGEPPTSHSRKLGTKLGWRLWEEQVPSGPRTNASQHTDLHLGTNGFFVAKEKKLKVQLADMGLHANSTTHLHALG